VDADGVAAAGNHVDIEDGGAVDGLGGEGGVGGFDGGVRGVGVDFSYVFAFAEEGEGELDVARVPVW
jgi:hypothetical protein